MHVDRGDEITGEERKLRTHFLGEGFLIAKFFPEFNNRDDDTKLFPLRKTF